MDTLDLRAAELMGEQRNALSRMHDEVILGMTEDTDNTYRIRTQEEGICGGSFGINYTGMTVPRWRPSTRRKTPSR